MKVRDEFAAEDAFGQSESDSIRNLLASDTDDNCGEDMMVDDDPHLATGDEPKASTRPAKGSSLKEVPDDDWPKIGETSADKDTSRSFTDVVKSAKSSEKCLPTDKSSESNTGLPHLKHSEPLVTPKGVGKSNRKKKRSGKKFKPVKLTTEEKSFLQSKKNKYNKSTLTSTPRSKEPWPHSKSLSPTQREAIIDAGLPPDSDFVRNVVASKIAKK